jgi:hypothetical protein
MKVRLTRKLSDRLDGVDLRSRRVGQVFDLPLAQAHLLLAEQWAVRADDPKRSLKGARSGAAMQIDESKPLDPAARRRRDRLNPSR